ncbi:hypothetical protein SRB17_09290 [Streptomyces sp. RB17]|uniref:hypothetical protein n=1 Tax=Streptomyces sp. RB17 TaxID=2585197 RepID=UPI00129533DB|nr:hypothetical protein [Streptomyces sp. RB17]MQY32969.1 hypothetical protein [Streptomyces sp. RB17]
MRGILASGTVVLVILGIGNHLWWLAAVALLYLYVTHGRGSPGTPPPAGASTPPPPESYRAYRERRDRQAKWERRYRRERPFEARRQEREKSR